MSEAFKQDLKGNKGPVPGGPFLMQLLFKEPPAMPDQAVMTAVLGKHVGAVNCYSRDDKMAGFEALEYMAEFKEGKAPVQLMVMASNEFTGKGIDAFVKSQMWDCPDPGAGAGGVPLAGGGRGHAGSGAGRPRPGQPGHGFSGGAGGALSRL